MNRFIRTKQLIGADALGKIKKLKVAVFGLGAVGSFAVEMLARSGVGEFLLIDFDEIRLTNFNRQLLALESTLGKLKTEAARDRILDINPYCKVIVHSDFAAAENIDTLLTPRPDIIIDAIDSLNPKTELISFCFLEKIPFVSSMGSGGRTNPFSVKTADISEVRNCPLAKRLKKRLNKKGIEKGVLCVYSAQKPIDGEPVVEAETEEFYQRGRKRNPIGTISYMPGIFGLVIGYEALNLVIKPRLRIHGE
ncbi:MAG: tRNA threonylcarbamoyladenosine dehydratase [Candidatus Omnitrophota bacterium]